MTSLHSFIKVIIIINCINQSTVMNSCIEFYIDCCNQKLQASISVLNCLTNIHIIIQVIISFTGRSHQSMVMIVIMLITITTGLQYYNPFMSIDKNGYGLTSWLLFIYDRAHLAQKYAKGISEYSWGWFYVRSRVTHCWHNTAGERSPRVLLWGGFTRVQRWWFATVVLHVKSWFREQLVGGFYVS